jgi:hypothetical protein
MVAKDFHILDQCFSSSLDSSLHNFHSTLSHQSTQVYLIHHKPPFISPRTLFSEKNILLRSSYAKIYFGFDLFNLSFLLLMILGFLGDSVVLT